MLPSRSASCLRGARLGFICLMLGSSLAFAGGKKHRKATPTPSPGESPEAIGLKNIPLTIGHEAKGIVFPNYDDTGHLVGRFQAETASRIDENHVRFTDLKMQTFDQKEQPDFDIKMANAILNLETRILESKARATLKRNDFEIAGDTMSFNTSTHQGTMTGNVHMTIFNQKEISGTQPKR
jgi:lipopolysaccharide assembly outer membrane protein LptD (OstA)